MMQIEMNIVLKTGHDFYYGYRPLKAGDWIKVVMHNGEIRVVASSKEQYPGWGIKISASELAQLKA